MQTMPWAVPNLPFGTTSHVSGGLLEAVPTVTPASQGSQERGEPLRLKAIESPDGTLLEHSYDTAGHLLETLYPDGVRVRYRWDEAWRLTTVHLSDGKSISYSYGKNSLLESATCPGGAQFRYQYDSFGNLLSCVYPDHKSIGHTYDRRNRPAEISFDNSRFTYDWDDNGTLRRVLLQTTSQLHELVLSCHSVDMDLMSNDDRTAGQFRLTSPLGIWVYSSEGRLSEMVLPNGERFCLPHGAAGREESFWGTAGQTLCRYDKDGILAAVLYPNGTRSVFQRVPGSHNVYLASASGVAIYQYDRNGQLVKIRADNGEHVLFGYNRRGAVNNIATSVGWIRLHHDDTARLCAVRFSTGASAELRYGMGAYPLSVSLRKIAPNGFAAVISLVLNIWQWTALKPTLRLEDRILKEV